MKNSQNEKGEKKTKIKINSKNQQNLKFKNCLIISIFQI